MNVPPIKPNSFEEFKKLPREEQFKYRLKGAVIDSINRNRSNYCHHIHIEPKDEFTYLGTLMASLGRIIKGITLK